MAIKTKTIDVRDFGAKGDATQAQGSQVITGTDDSAAFIAAVAFIIANTTRKSQWNEQGVRYILYVPAGRYLITQPGSLIPQSYTTPAIAGFTIRGDGREATEIHYKPSTSGTYLCDNRNGFQALHFADITFSSTGDSDGVLNNSFLRSNSQNQAQNYIFDRVNWSGGWKYLWHLVGINTNSECSWFHCGVYNSVVNALYIPPYNSSDSSISGSDQMVNYNFYSCQFEVWKGNYFRCDQGGAINIWGGSIINTSGTGVGDGTTNNTFFKLGLGAVSTNQGAYKLLVQGVRFEMRGSSNTKVIECNWKFGTVTFIGCDMEVHSWVSGVNNQVYAVFDFGSENGPVVQWIGCNFQGKHQYKYSSNGYQKRAQVLYQGCELWNWSMPEDFIIMTNNSGTTNRSSIPVIKFESCRGMNAAIQSLYITDTNMNWHLNYRGQGQKRTLCISGPDNKFPRTGELHEVYLPRNSLITSIIMTVAAGETTSTTAGWHYFVKTSDGMTLADITPISNNPSLGINTTTNISPPLFANSDAKRHLLVSSNSTVNSDVRGFILIEYIA